VISEERLNHFAHLVIDALYDDDLVDYEDDDKAMRVAIKAANQWAKEETNVEEIVRAKVASLKRQLIEGTQEWEIMYRKYYEEELNRRGQKS
jgi:uncharacterized protein